MFDYKVSFFYVTGTDIQDLEDNINRELDRRGLDARDVIGIDIAGLGARVIVREHI